MKIIKLGLLTGLLIGLVGCGDFWDEPKEEIEIETDGGPKRDLILKDELIKESVSLGRFSASEILEVQIEGKKFTPQFTEVYEKTHRSTWTRRICFPDRCPFCAVIEKIRDCYDESLGGKCNHKYRDQITGLELPLLFDKPVVDISLKFKIGKNLYPLGEIVEHQGNLIVTRFQISKEMLLEDDEIFLVVVPEPVLGQVKIGFQGLGACDGQGKANFKSGGPTGSSNVNQQDRIEYKASVILEQPKDFQ